MGLLLAGLLPSRAAADYVGSLVNRIFIDPASVQEIADGWQVGDEVSFILETTPADTGSDFGHAAWMTVYLPDGVQLIGAEYVLPAANGGYDRVPAEDTDDTYDGCSSRGCTFGTVTTGLGNGFVNEVQQDTGIFYSTDPVTRLAINGFDEDGDAVPDLVAPTGVADQLVYNEFDYWMTRAFGEGGDLDAGNGGRGHTPLIYYDPPGADPLDWYGTGSIVAGPDVYYTHYYHPDNDGTPYDPNNPVFDEDDLKAVGPWQRIAYENAKLGGANADSVKQTGDGLPPDLPGPPPYPIVPAEANGNIQLTAVPTCTDPTDVSTCTGWQLSDANPLPATTTTTGVNAVRFVHGARRLGELENARITLRVTDPQAIVDSFSNDTFCLDSTGGDTSDTAAKDNPFRYYEPQHECNFIAGSSAFVKQVKFVNNEPGNGASLTVGDVLSYEITLTNTTGVGGDPGVNLDNVDFTDIAEDFFGNADNNLDLIEPDDPLYSADCAWDDYNGTYGPGMNLPTYTAGSSDTLTASWATLPSLGPGEQVSIFICARVTGGGVNTQVDNTAHAAYSFTQGMLTENVTVRSTVGGTISTSISGNVYADPDASGNLTPGDAGVGGITVTLYLDDGGTPGVYDGTNTVVATTTTLSDGSYAFNGIAAGSYVVVESDPSGWTSTGDKDTSAGSCGALGLADACNTIGTISVSAGGASTLNDFFDQPPASDVNTVSGTVFVDNVLQDGVQDPGDPGADGVAVRLYRDSDGSGTFTAGDILLQTQTTDSDGNYFFTVVEEGDFVVNVDPATIPLGASFTTDNVETATFVGFGNSDVDNDFGFYGGVGSTGGVCFAVADNGNRTVAYNISNMSFVDIGPTGVSNIEAIAYQTGTDVLYGANAGQLGTIDLTTGAFTPVPGAPTSQTCTLPGGAGTVTVNDLDSLAFDPFTGILYGVERDGDGSTPEDVLLQLDPETGLVVPNAFSGGTASCVRIPTNTPATNNRVDVDDIAVDPADGQMYAITNSGGALDRLIRIDKFTGAVTDVGATGQGGDFEGLGFANDGTLFGTNGPATNGQLFRFNTPPALPSVPPTAVFTFPQYGDYEAVDCMTAGANRISGTTFFDVDGDGVFEPTDGDIGQPGVTVNLYIDNNDDGVVDGGDTLIQTEVTGSAGGYEFLLGADGNFVIETVFPATYPAGATLTTDNVEEADFVGVNMIDTGNNFGFQAPADLNVTKVSNAVGDVVPGQLIEYTITVSNPAGATVEQTGIRVFDSAPEGTSYVPDSTLVTGFLAGPFELVAADDFGTDDYSGGTGVACGTVPCGWAADWVEINDNNDPGGGSTRTENRNGSVQLRTDDNSEGAYRQVDLTGFLEARLSFDYEIEGANSSDDGFVLAICPSGAGCAAAPSTVGWTALETVVNQPATIQSRTVDITPYIAAGTRIRLLGNPGNDKKIWLDNVQIDGRPITAGSKDNVAGGGTPDLLNGSTPNLVIPNDGFVLRPADSMTVVLEVVVDEPLDPFRSQIFNEVVVSSDQSPPAVADASDPVSPGALIGDLVWLDTDRDGILDVGEEGIPNTTVTLYADPDGIPDNGDEVAIATMVTDANGTYAFEHLYPVDHDGDGGAVTPRVSTFYVQVDETTVPGGLVRSPGNVGGISPSIDITGITEFLDADFGYTTSATEVVIGDYVWSDADGDGIQDPGEAGVGGVTVNLVSPGPDGLFGTGDDVVAATSTTRADGYYLFTGVAAGDYRVEIDASNFTPGAALEGRTATSGPQSQGSETSVPITVVPGDIYVDADFGYDNPSPGSIGNRIFDDANANGVFDPASESGIGNVTVDLIQDVNGDGVWDPDGLDDIPGNGDDELVIATTVTGSGGLYSFDGLALDDGDGDADYLVAVTDKNAVVTGFGPTFGLVGVDENGQIPPFPVALSGGTPSVVVADFGYTAGGVVGDLLWNDVDGNGARDPGEPGIGGITMALASDPGPDLTYGTPDDVILATTVTSADGSYLFTGLVPGAYTVLADVGPDGIPGNGDEELAALGYTQVSDPEADNNGRGTATVPRFGSDLTMDFGYQNAGLPDVSGNVFNDLDLDGFDDGAGEPGIGGVTIALLDASGNVVATTTTDANGDYLFSDVPTGDYTVAVTDDDQVLYGYFLTSGLDAIDITVPPGGVTGINFGYARESSTGSIGQTVWLDVDGDGLLGPSEARLAGVTVDLYDVGPDGLFGTADDVGVVASAETDAAGDYLFDNVPAGNYVVQVTDVNGVLTGLSETTYPGMDPHAVISLAEGASFREANFGYRPPAGSALLGDRVWYDAIPAGSPNGVQESGEVGIEGVTVQVIGTSMGSSCNPTPCEVVTGPDGEWLLAVDPGDYFVTFDSATLPAGYSPTPTNNGGDNVYSLTAADGDVFTNLDFGFAGGTTGTIGDLVYLDRDANSIFDGTDSGIEDVSLDLQPLFTVLGGGVDLNNDGFANAADNGFASGVEVIGSLLDLNGDGSITAADSGTFRGVSVIDGALDMDGSMTITGADNGTVVGQTVATTTTDSAGAYLFTGVPPGNYQVVVTDINGALADLNPTQVAPSPITITGAGETVLTADSGYAAAAGTASIGNQVWHDKDGDGLYEPLGDDGIAGTADDEPGLPGVTIDLWLDDGDGVFEPYSAEDNYLRTVVTDANGEYFMDALPPGMYWIDPTDTGADGVGGTGDEVTGGMTKTIGPSPGADDNSQAEPYLVTLAGVSNFTGDFGYESTDNLVISGTVFEDADNDGLLDSPGDPLISGATVTLYRILDGMRIVYDTYVSDPVTGFYEFTDLPPGDYEIETQPSGTYANGYQQTTQTGTGGVQPVTLVAANSTGNNFGFFKPTTTTPVTLAYFEARAGGSFRWMTSTEVGNLGFNLYAMTDAGLEKLNDELIASPVIDSLEPQTYEFEARGGTGETFILEDVDIHGTLRHHGPFYLEQPEGADATQVRAVAWGAIRDQAGRKLLEKRGSTPYAQRARQPLAPGTPGTPGTVGALGKSSAPIRQGDDPRCLGCDRGRRSRYGSADLGVDRVGIYRVSYEDLLAHGIDLTGAPSSALALTNGGVPVPLFVSSPAAFGPGSYVEFVGEPVDTLYTKTNVYRLSVDRWRAQRVDEAPFAGEAAEAFYLERQAFENQSQYNFASQSEDPWYDLRILAYSGPAAADVTFELDAWMPGFAPVEIDLDLAGGTDFPIAPDHHLVIDVNGSQIAESYFDGAERPELRLPVSDGVLAPGSNTVTLALPHDTGAEFDLVNYDSMTVTYPRAFVARNESLAFASDGSGFAVSGFGDSAIVAYGRRSGRSVRLAAQVEGAPGAYEARFSGVSGTEDGRYWVASTSGLLAPIISATRRPDGLTRHKADVVVISHESFLSGLDPWVERRESEGLRVQVVDVADLYAEYGHGLVDPAAIRKFIGIAEASMKTRYVLLVGGDTYDYFDYLGVGSISFVPSLYAQTDAIVRYAPVDPLYGDVDGDLIPDLAVGRWPVRTLAELEVVIGKTLEYDNTGRALRAVMASDGRDAPTGYSFTADSTDMAELLGTGWDVEHVSLDDLAVPDAREALVAGINAGPSLTSYFGHSSLSVWSFDGLFESADVDLLTNSSAPTIVTQWGCWNTYHVLPTFETLGNRLLLEPDAGAAAVLGASTLTEALSERRLGMRLFDLLSTPGLRLGNAVTAAKRDLAETEPERLDVILGWTLLGDPTLTVVPNE